MKKTNLKPSQNSEIKDLDPIHQELEDNLFENNNSLKIPQHVAIIMDGNGRWAANKNLPTIAGHKAGAETVRRILKEAVNKNIKYLTLYTFSTDNWLRPKKWINDIFGLMKFYLKNELSELKKNDVKIKIIGDTSQLPKDLVRLINQAEIETSNNSKLTLILAISYGARDELVKAVQDIANKVVSKEINPADINKDMISNHLYTSNIPDPDLLIRTSGEQRLSNYLLWQLAYTEFVFTHTFWPDFTVEEFNLALDEFTKRNRRYGTISYYKK